MMTWQGKGGSVVKSIVKWLQEQAEELEELKDLGRESDTDEVVFRMVVEAEEEQGEN